MPGMAPPTRACRKWRAPSRGRAGTALASSGCGTKRLESARDAPSPEAVAVRDLHAGLAARERCTRRHVANTIPPAFLGPDFVRAAIDARLPRGINVRRIATPKLEWPRQWDSLGIRP